MQRHSRVPAKVCFLVLTVLVILSNLACSTFRAKDRSYLRLVEPFENLDTLPLEGRVIVLDPGHGGFAPGAVGSKGLEEKHVNLQVALRLKQFLEEARAHVIMTRSEDTELIIDPIDSLRGDDLDFRVRLSSKTEADLFISLHHNSRLPLDRKYSAIETYYKMEDYFSSKDAARFIHKHLVKNLQIPLNFLRPGNYYVLRNNTRTAVLGEASYISNPQLEKKLSQPESIELEAKSYFLGILDYFSRGIPKIEKITPEMETVLDNALPVFTISVQEDRYGEGIDPQSIVIGIDDTEIPYSYNPPILTAAPAKPLSSGSHRLYVSMANLKGNHSLLYESHFAVDLPPATIIVTNATESIPPDGKTPMVVTALVLDKYNNAVRDSTPVYFKTDEFPHFNSSDFTRDGLAHFYFTHEIASTIPYSLHAGMITHQGTIAVEPQNSPMITFSINGKTSQTVYPLENARVELNGEQFGHTNRDGHIVFNAKQTGTQTVSIRHPGYYPANSELTAHVNDSYVQTVYLESVYNGSLFGKKILIDPEYGGLLSGSVGPTGLRAADENMETARYLLRYLRTTGADAEVTIAPGDDLSPYSRVRLANAMGAELFVTLRRVSHSNTKSTGISTYAYPTSDEGKRFGKLVLRSFSTILNITGTGPIEAADYVLQQTGCPASIINLGNISNPVLEEQLYATRRNRLEAYAIFTALVNYYSGEDTHWGEFSGKIVGMDGKPVNHALISLGETVVLQTNADGSFTFTTLEPRNYSVIIQAKGFKTHRSEITVTPIESVKKTFILMIN